MNVKINKQPEGNFFSSLFKSHIFSIITIFSTIFGGLVVFDYLNSIGYVSLFPVIILSPPTLIVIIIVAFIYLFIGGVGIFSPYIFFLHIRKDNSSRKRVFLNSIFITLSVGCILFFAFFYFYKYLRDFPDVKDCIFILIIIFPVFTVGRWIYKLWCVKGRKKRWDKVIDNGVYLYVCYFLTNIYSMVYGGLLFVEFIGDNEKWIFPWIGILFLNCCMANILYINRNIKNFNSVFWVIPFVFLCVVAILVGMYGNRVSEKLLYPVRFVERPSDASWYLLRSKLNNNDGVTISEFDLQRIQEGFHCIPEKECRILYKYHRSYHRLNALYGYMAWNAGETRILCPRHIRLDELNNNKDKCLVIEGKYLQPMNDGQYIDRGLGSKITKYSDKLLK